jgi:hypothetical protein
MQFFTLSVLSLVGAGMVSALPGQDFSVRSESKCVGPLLCCGELKTPLDPVVDPLLLALGVDAANIVGSIGLACMFTILPIFPRSLLTYVTGHGYDSSCEFKPQCCTEANLLVSDTPRHSSCLCMTNRPRVAPLLLAARITRNKSNSIELLTDLS